jgi:aspartyl aminopeptidase
VRRRARARGLSSLPRPDGVRAPLSRLVTLVISSPYRSRRRYATDAMTGFVVRELGKLAGAPVQEFVVRNDCACGSTIGPILATQLGVRTCDVGMPQLSMHSCREMMGADDLSHCHALLAAFFESFRDVDARLQACAPPKIDA